jgi:hypothetical protein
MGWRFDRVRPLFGPTQGWVGSKNRRLSVVSNVTQAQKA